MVWFYRSFLKVVFFNNGGVRRARVLFHSGKPPRRGLSGCPPRIVEDGSSVRECFCGLSRGLPRFARRICVRALRPDSNAFFSLSKAASPEILSVAGVSALLRCRDARMDRRKHRCLSPVAARAEAHGVSSRRCCAVRGFGAESVAQSFLDVHFMVFCWECPELFINFAKM